MNTGYSTDVLELLLSKFETSTHEACDKQAQLKVLTEKNIEQNETIASLMATIKDLHEQITQMDCKKPELKEPERKELKEPELKEPDYGSFAKVLNKVKDPEIVVSRKNNTKVNTVNKNKCPSKGCTRTRWKDKVTGELEDTCKGCIYADGYVAITLDDVPICSSEGCDRKRFINWKTKDISPTCKGCVFADDYVRIDLDKVRICSSKGCPRKRFVNWATKEISLTCKNCNFAEYDEYE